MAIAMGDLILELVLLAAGIILLIKGSDLFVDSGSAIGKVLKISEILIGMTIVAFGTSLPELIISITSAQTNSNEIALGNILGTSIFNICGILAMIAIISPIKFKKDTVRKDMYMSIASAFVFLLVMADKMLIASDINIISRADGLILLVFFVIFMYYNLFGYIDVWKERKTKDNEIKLKLKDIDALTINILKMILGLILVFVGAKVAVNSVEKTAAILGISETLISIVVIAVGTSLPEIFTSISAIKKGKHDIAVGNLIGSNMFNILFVIGTAATISPITLQMDSLIIDGFVFLAAMVMLLLHARIGKENEISRGEGLSLIAIYISYLVFVIMRG